MNKQVTIVVPAFNEARRLPASFDLWQQSGLLASFPLILVDDGSADDTRSLVRAFASRVNTIRPLLLEHSSKLRAIEVALSHVSTPYVLCLDADTWFAGDMRILETELARLASDGVQVAAFRLEPCGSRSLVVALQRVEYAFVTDAARRLFGIVGNANGAAVFWDTQLLRNVLARHSGVFEGDDLEATLIAHRLGAKVAGSPLAFRKHAKASFGELARQRVRVWDFGLFDVLRRCPPIRLRHSPEVVFFQWYLLFEGVLQPVKMGSFAILFAHAFGICSVHLERAGQVLLTIYTASAVISALALIRLRIAATHRLRLLALLVVLALYPSLHLALDLNTAGIGMYFAYWSAIAALHSLAIARWQTRAQSLLLSPLMPAYFLLVSVGFRSAGLLTWCVAAARRQLLPRGGRTRRDLL